MNALGKLIKERYDIDVEAVGRKAVILAEHKSLKLGELRMICTVMNASDIEVSAYDGADVPGDQHPQLMLRLIK